MKGRIDENGDLWLMRGGGDRMQECPHADTLVLCGDWCPLFGEPHVMAERPTFTRLVLCRKEWLFKEFKDERGEG